jgi:ABC transporter with metal-binding/Fe-S-binding domain ATP-binding protein
VKLAALFSGGKDSTFALYIAQQYGWNITHLVTLAPEKQDSWMFHSLNIHVTDQLADALDIPLVKKTTQGEKEKELQDLLDLLQHLEIDGVISGAISSEYQRTRIEKICYELEIKSFTPLWHIDQEVLLRDQVHAGFNILIVGVFAQGFNEQWLGRTIDEHAIKELNKIRKNYSINTAGEGGEFETLVVDGPIFQKKLVIDETEKKWKRDHGILRVIKAHLE